jgi:hypothetical protein
MPSEKISEAIKVLAELEILFPKDISSVEMLLKAIKHYLLSAISKSLIAADNALETAEKLSYESSDYFFTDTKNQLEWAEKGLENAKKISAQIQRALGIIEQEVSEQVVKEELEKIKEWLDDKNRETLKKEFAIRRAQDGVYRSARTKKSLGPEPLPDRYFGADPLAGLPSRPVTEVPDSIGGTHVRPINKEDLL